MYYGITISVTDLHAEVRLGFAFFLITVESQKAHLDTEPPGNKITLLYGQVSWRRSSRAQTVTTMNKAASQNCTKLGSFCGSSGFEIYTDSLLSQ